MSKHVSTSKDTFSSYYTTVSEFAQITESSSGTKKRSKSSVFRRTRQFITCGVSRQSSSPPINQSTEPKEKSTSNMATNKTNETKYHTLECNGVYYTVPVRYENPVFAGQGAFGAVIRVKDKVLNEDVAIKKMLKAFDTATHAKRTYRELKLLTHLNDPLGQVVELYDVFTPDKNLQNFQSLYFVFNYARYDLDEVIKKRKPFVESTIKQIMYGLLRGLKFMHSAGVIHRDLKPSNIGIDNNGNVFILDFGLARVASKGIQTGYVSTRWWRAPEIYVNWEHYNEKLDIWSAGCIMAELVLLKPIFRGKDHIDQLNKIFQVIGTPSSEVVNKVCTPDTASYINGLNPKPGKADYNKLFGFKYEESSTTPSSGLSADGIELLDKLLTFDHTERPTAQQALEHKFFKGLHEQGDEPVAESLIDEHDDATHSISTWKSIIWQMIQEFSPPSWLTD